MSKRFEIFGRVQGVGFRAYSRGLALDLNLEIEVWNRADGAVEAIVRGEDSALDTFETRLWQGPGRVDRVTANLEPVS